MQSQTLQDAKLWWQERSSFVRKGHNRVLILFVILVEGNRSLIRVKSLCVLLTISLLVWWWDPHKQSGTIQLGTAKQRKNPQKRCSEFHKHYVCFGWSNWASTPLRFHSAMMLQSSFQKTRSTFWQQTKCLHLGCHSRSFLRRTPGDTSSRWARWGPLACLGHPRDALTGWYQRTQSCRQKQFEDKTLFSYGQLYISKN